MSIAVRATNLGKKYRIGHIRDRYLTLRDVLTNAALAPFRRIRSLGQASFREEDTIWALRDVSFDVEQGEVLGIIGANGAGKSTLLKVLTRITEPSTGMAEMNGRVGSLLEVGTGFHPELTGRENIYLSGAILGMSRREITANFDDIVAFSGVERFIETPIKRYSSGMNVRLGFAVAAYLQPEILLIDEVLAVGDAEFQKRCLGKMSGIAESGRTILFVSHNLPAVMQLCTRVIWLRSGRIEAEGPTDEIVRQYLLSTRNLATETISLAERDDRRGSGVLQLTDASIVDEFGDRLSGVLVGDSVRFAFSYEVLAAEIGVVTLWLTVSDEASRRRLLSAWSQNIGQAFTNVPRRGRFVCEIPRVSLRPGTYTIGIAVFVDGVRADGFSHVMTLEILEGDYYGHGRPQRTGEYYHDFSWAVAENHAPSRSAKASPKNPSE